MADTVHVETSSTVAVRRVLDVGRVSITYPLLAVYGALLLASLAQPNRVGVLIGLGCWSLYALAYLAARRWPAAVRAALPYVASLATAWIVAQSLTRGGRPWNPNIMASLLLLTLPFLHTMPQLFCVAVVALGLTGSRAAWLGLAVAVLTLLGQPWWRSLRGGQAVLIALVVLLVLTGAVIGLAIVRPHSVYDRLNEYQRAAAAFVRVPFVGNGPWSCLVDSLPLTIAAEQGTVGLFAWAWLFVTVLYQAVTTRDNPARLAMLAWFFHNALDYTLWDIPSSILAAAVLALLFTGGERGYVLARDRQVASVDVALPDAKIAAPAEAARGGA